MFQIHNNFPTILPNSTSKNSKHPNFDSMELACSIDLSKISNSENHQIEKYALEAPFSMQDMATEESHQLITPKSKAFNGIATLSKVVEAHKGLRHEVLASTAPSDNIAQNPRLSSLLLSKQTAPALQNASEKISSTATTTRKNTQLTKSSEALPEKPKARTTTKRHTEPIKINTLKLCRDIEKKQRIRDNKPYVDLGSDDSEEMKEKIYEVPYSPSDYEGAVILERLPEESEMDEVEGLGGAAESQTQQEEIEKSTRRWNKFIIKSTNTPKKEKYQPSFVVIPPEDRSSKRQSFSSQVTQQSKGISRDMIAIRKLFEKETEPTIATERTPTTVQSYRLKLNTTPRKTPTPRASMKNDARIDQLMMLDSAWNGLETIEHDSSSDGKNDAMLQGRDSPLIKRSQSLENLQGGGRKIRQSIQAIRPMISVNSQSEESSPVLVKDRHGSVSSLPRNAEKVLKILDVNFPFKAPETGKMINIKDLIENNRSNKSGMTSPEKKRRGLDNIFGISPQVSRKGNTSDATPKVERSSSSRTFKVVDLEKSLPEKNEEKRAANQKYWEGFLQKTTVVQKKELNSMARKDNGLARK